MTSYILDEKDIPFIKGVLDAYEFLYEAQGNVIYAEKNIEIIFEMEGVGYTKP